MPTTKTHQPDQFDLDVAQLREPLTDAQLDALDAVLEARDAARDAVALLEHMQAVIEAGADPYRTREQFGVDLEQATEAVARHTSEILGADQGTY
jgi:hypothetical protein